MFIVEIIFVLIKSVEMVQIWLAVEQAISRFKVQGSLLFVTYTIIQGIIGSEMLE